MSHSIGGYYIIDDKNRNFLQYLEEYENNLTNVNTTKDLIYNEMNFLPIQIVML